MLRFKRFIFAYALLGTISIFLSSTASAERVRAVLELFTSQGCNYCIPADDFFQEFSADPSIITLSFHVDYWDYLGWHDTFARKKNGTRQNAYAMARGDQAVYTPQVVLNGEKHFVGSDRQAIYDAIAEVEAFPIDVSVKTKGKLLEIEVSSTAIILNDPADVYLLRVLKEAIVEIERGENAGKMQRYTNIIRDVMPIGLWSGEDKIFQLPTNTLDTSEDLQWVVIVQTMKNGFPSNILGASFSGIE